MERGLFSFIWKYSRRDQIMLLGLTLVTFPFLYASLELPKRIINDAIGSGADIVPVFGFELTQIQFLLLLCFGFLGAVTAHGLLKMRLNTMKGIVAERMLRRFRYMLLSRMMRFPKPYFRTTSQGELVSMVTSEAEPMGGLMGDALAQPVFQAGQMLIILVFLFLQSVWFGLAAIALIPLQAYIIPMLQRQINLLNKDRIQEIRSFASEIGESAAGIADLRTNGGVRYRLSMFGNRLGRLFRIRFRIYQKKFFMKFLNNFITQLTPFFFYSVGGVLAIRGDITVGALVAALAAYKDLSSPWKELLAYYNQTQDMSLRWEIVTERFAPRDMIPADLFEGEPETVPHLRGDIELKDVTVRNADGNAVLERINLSLPKGARVAIQVTNQQERIALAELFTREVLPARGSVVVDGHNLADLHQGVISARIGHAHSRPYLFDGTLWSNVVMSLMVRPLANGDTPLHRDYESVRSGNSLDPLDADWVDPTIANLEDRDAIRQWWFSLVQAMGIDEFMFRRMLSSFMVGEDHPELAKAIVAARAEVRERIREKGLDEFVYQFDPEKFNPAVPLGGNLMFAIPRKQLKLVELSTAKNFLSVIFQHGIAEQVIAISQTIVEELHQTFGHDGTEHPLFMSLNIEEEMYERLVDVAKRRREKGDDALSEEEFSLLLTVPFAFTAEQIGPAFPDSFKNEIVEIRKRFGKSIRDQASEMFVEVAPESYLNRLTILENTLYGRISRLAGNRAEEIENVVAEVLSEQGLRRRVAQTVLEIPTGIGGANLPTAFQERASFSRAAMKRPDILIMDQALASHDADARSKARLALRDLMPETTLIFLEDKFANPHAYDVFVEIRNGRVDGVKTVAEDDDEDEEGSDDLRRKVMAIGQTELFGQLDMRNQRLLAFAAAWFKAKPGQTIFAVDDKPDAAYLCVSGQAELLFTRTSGEEQRVTTVEPGRVIGDLAIIIDEPRTLTLRAITEVTFLRIGAEEFRAVMENDTSVLLTLLRSVSGHLTNTAEMLRQLDAEFPDRELPQLESDET
jgi:putative ABC transport system ATP-binding protein